MASPFEQPYGPGAVPVDPFGQQPIEAADPFADAPLTVPESWRSLVESSPDTDPAAPPQPLDPFAIAPEPPQATPTINLGQPRAVTGEMPPDEAAALAGLQDPLAVPAPAAPQPAPMSFFGAPVTGPIDQVEVAKGVAASDIGAEPQVEEQIAPDYLNPLDNPNLDEVGLGRELANVAPERYATLRAEREFAKQRAFAAKEAEALEQRQRAAEDSARVFRDAQVKAQKDSEALQVEAKELASRKVDDAAWFKSRSVPQTIAAFVSAIVGGLMQSKTGGRNMGLEAILKMADDHVETQKFNLQQQRAALQQRQGAVNDQLARAGDVYRAGEVLRVATYERVAQQIETEKQKYDQRSAKAFALADALRGIRSAQAQAIEAQRRRSMDETIKLGEFEIKASAEQRARDVAAAKLRAAGAGTGLLTPAQIKAEFGIDVDRPMSQKDINARLEGRAKAQELSKNAPATGLSKDQLERVIPGLETKDGQPFFAAGDVTEAKKLRDTVALTESIVRAMDNVIRIRASKGWSSDIAKSPEWRESQALWTNAMLKAKGEGVYQLGVLAGPDVEMLGRALGAADPTTVQDPTPGIKKAREVLLDDLNATARSLDPTRSLKRFDIPFVDPGSKPKNTPTTAAVKVLEDKVRAQDFPDVSALPRSGLGYDTEGSIPPDRARALDDLRSSAMGFASPSASVVGDSETAFKALDHLVKKGGNAAIRQRAKLILDEATSARSRSLVEGAKDPRLDRLQALDARARAGDKAAAREAKAIRDEIDRAPARPTRER